MARPELAPGQTFETVVVADLKRTQIVQYAGASGDYNPLHTDESTPPRSRGTRRCSRTGC